MKKVILGLSALCMVAFTSCKEDAASKVKSENVAVAAERDANAGNFPVLKLDKEVHDFGTIMNGTPVETKFKYTQKKFFLSAALRQDKCILIYALITMQLLNAMRDGLPC